MLTDEERRQRGRESRARYQKSAKGRAARARASAAYRARAGDRIRLMDRLKWIRRQMRAGRLFCEIMRRYRRFRGMRHDAPAVVVGRYIKPSRMAEARALLERLRAEREISRRRAQA